MSQVNNTKPLEDNNLLNPDYIIDNNKFVIFSKVNCKYCEKSTDLMKNNNIQYYKFNMSDYLDHEDFDDIFDKLMFKSNIATSYPMIFIDKLYIGGFNQLTAYIKNLDNQKMFNSEDF